MKLYSYHRSSAAYRVRIALNLKGVEYRLQTINILKAEHRSDDYLAINSYGLIPALEISDGKILNQSPAILEWLEETYPSPALLPADAFERAAVRAQVSNITCDTHPLNNLRVLSYLSEKLSVTADQKQSWYAHWINTTFASLESELSNTQDFAGGASVNMLDVCLVPQVYNALRFKVGLSQYRNILRVYENCNRLAAFHAAAPEQQPDKTIV